MPPVPGCAFGKEYSAHVFSVPLEPTVPKERPPKAGSPLSKVWTASHRYSTPNEMTVSICTLCGASSCAGLHRTVRPEWQEWMIRIFEYFNEPQAISFTS